MSAPSRRLLPTLLLMAVLLWPAPAIASEVTVVKAVFRQSGGAWQVSVTLRHADTGWEHYASLWVVEDAKGRELGRRVLFHPHVDEQPFTRSERIAIPPGVTRVFVRAGEKPGGLNSNRLEVDLTRASGPGYQVVR